MIQPINRRAINQGLQRWPINRTAALGGGGGVPATAIRDRADDPILDRAGEFINVRA